ncbi:hypothetical protein IMX07_09130 [bacterium]|jgi:hypothetical protein|nr:hypothetical protein [bacterium]
MNRRTHPHNEPLSLAGGIAHLSRIVVEPLRAIGRELARLNRLGLRAGESPDLPRRIRARQIRAALAMRHDGRNRCC